MADKQIRTDIDDIEQPEFNVFTQSDLSPDGKKIASTIPLWYNPTYKEELENTIAIMSHALREGQVPEGRRSEYQANLKMLKDRLQSIDDAIPKFDKKAIDYVSRVISSLSEKIRNAMFTRDEMMKGLADPNEEARRMTQPCITLTEHEIRWAKACNVKVYDGKASRTACELMWKIGRRILGEPTNVEVLRKDR